MKTKYLILFYALMASLNICAQEGDMTSGTVVNRAPVPAEGLDAPVRRAAPRHAPAATWSYPTSTPTTPFAGGSGTQADPYKIATAQQLANMAYMVNKNSAYRSKYYELIQDIELNTDVLNEDRSLKTVGTPWTPIGNYSAQFTGHFNGNGHSVRGIYINSTTSNYIGLFGYINSATIENVGVEDGFIYGCCLVGGIAGYAYGGSILNCFNTCTLYSRGSALGGIVGYTYTSTSITACYNGGEVYGYGQSCSHGYNGNCVAGIAGAVCTGATITYCYNTGSVYGGAYSVSGIASPNNHTGPTVQHCHNIGQVTCYSKLNVGAVVDDAAAHGFTISPTTGYNYCLEGSSLVHKYSTEQTATQFADGTVLALIDSEGAYFKQGHEYPVLKFVTEPSNEVVLAEGKCGEDVYWKITQEGELVIWGSGAMYDYGAKAIAYIQQLTPQAILAGIATQGIAASLAAIKLVVDQSAMELGLAPWIDYTEQIKKITVEEGVTTIGQGAFLLLTAATQASIPSTIDEVGSGAFAFCMTLQNLYSYAVIPPAMTGLMKDYTFCYTANNDVTNYNNPQYCLLHVPTPSKESYAAAEGWKLFTRVANELSATIAPALALTDDSYTIVPGVYSAGNISYTRTGDGLAEGNYAALCLPFSINVAEAADIAAAYVPLDFVFYNANTEELTMSFVEETDVIPAGMPFLARLSGSTLQLQSQADSRLTGYETPLTQTLKVFDYTAIGGIMRQNSDVSVVWTGSFAPATVQDAWLFATDGSLAAASSAQPFRTVVNATGNVTIKGINAIVGQPGTGILGDLNGDGRVDATDLTCLGNLILYGTMNPEE